MQPLLSCATSLYFYMLEKVESVGRLFLLQWEGKEKSTTLAGSTFEPHAPAVEYTDNFGNLCQRVLIPKGNFEVRCSCRAHTADVVDVDPKAGFVPVQELPESALQFLLPSRYCQSDLLNELASSIVGHAPAP